MDIQMEYSLVPMLMWVKREYLRRSLASRGRRRKGNPLLGEYSWATLSHGPSGWGLDSRLTNLLFVIIIVANSKEVKPG
jgi:hypothetical protein